MLPCSSVMVFLDGDSNLRLEHADLFKRDLFALKVVVVLEGHIARSPVVVRGTVSFLEA